MRPDKRGKTGQEETGQSRTEQDQVVLVTKLLYRCTYFKQ